MVQTAVIALLFAFSAAAVAPSQSRELDLRSILSSAAARLAAAAGTSIRRDKLAEGLCLTREDGDLNSGCREQPPEVPLLLYGQITIHPGPVWTSSSPLSTTKDIRVPIMGKMKYVDLRYNESQCQTLVALRDVAIFTELKTVSLLGLNFRPGLFAIDTRNTGGHAVNCSDASVGHSLETLILSPGECARVKRTGEEKHRMAIAYYRLPLKGYVSVWLQEAKNIRGQEGIKELWQIPVKTLLQIAQEMGLAKDFVIPLDGDSYYSGLIDVKETTISDTTTADYQCQTEE